MMLKINWVSIRVCHLHVRVPSTAISSDFPTKIILNTRFALHLSRNTSELHPHCEYNDNQLTVNSRSGTRVENSHCTPLRHSSAADYALNAFKT